MRGPGPQAKEVTGMNPVGVSSWIWLSPFTDADAPALVNTTEQGLGFCDLVGSANVGATWAPST